MEKIPGLINPLKKIYLEKIVLIRQEYNFSENIFELAKNFVFLLVDENISPDRITDLYEDGYSFMFMKNNHLTYFEIYPDGEFGFITFDKENNYKVIHNEDIIDFKRFIEWYKREK